jgi:hypothetical protein
MPSVGLPAPLRALAVRKLIVDQLTAEVAGLFDDAGIDCMLVKGPVIGDWLYAEGIRRYVDSDLLVAQADWDRATALLLRHGFHDKLAAMAHPRLESFASRGFFRGTDAIDLHLTLPGLEAPPNEVWNALWADARCQEIGGRLMAVPARPAVLMHLALHAANHHDEPKPLEDLRRGVLVAGLNEWRQAAELAEELDGLAAFASGLRRLPEGSSLAQSLDVAHLGSVHFDLRLAGVPTAEGLHELLRPGRTAAQRASIVLSELFPNPSFMRWWTPLARRSNRGLVASYPVRWLWLAGKVPGGLMEVRKARRRRPG